MTAAHALLHARTADTHNYSGGTRAQIGQYVCRSPALSAPACAPGPCSFAPLVGMDGCVVWAGRIGMAGGGWPGRAMHSRPVCAANSSVVSAAIHTDAPSCWHLWYYSPKYGAMSSKPRGALLLPSVGLLIHQQQPRAPSSQQLMVVQ